MPRFSISLILITLFALSSASADSIDSLSVRPGAGGPPTPIDTTIYIVDVREIDGARQIFTADVFIRLQWKDARLASSEVLRTMPTNVVWNPGIQIVNRATIQTTLPELLEIDKEGNVTYRQRYIGQFSCLLDLTEFPFDKQVIPIKIVVPGTSTTDVRFLSNKESGHAARFSMTDWKVTSWTAKEEQYQVTPGGRALPGYTFEFTAQRHFLFFLVQIIIPMTLILGMSWIVFWLDPNQPGPRISISITSMLTVVAYRLLLGNFLPRLPFLTRMDYFVVGCTFLVFLSLVNVVLISRLILAKKELLAVKLDTHSRWILPGLFLVVVCFSFLT